MKTITLDNGSTVQIPETFQYAKCRGCPATDLIWGKTVNGKNIPIHWVEGKGWVCHFADCKSSNDFRKDKTKKKYKPKFEGNHMEIPQSIIQSIKNSEEAK
jgi:hypothetical protein